MKITIENLSKVFNDGTQALIDVNLVIEDGIFGLIGPNASGKTTLIRILATLEKPTSGRILFDDMDLQKNRAAIRSMTGYLLKKKLSHIIVECEMRFETSLSNCHRTCRRGERVHLANDDLACLRLF